MEVIFVYLSGWIWDLSIVEKLRITAKKVGEPGTGSLMI